MAVAGAYCREAYCKGAYCKKACRKGACRKEGSISGKVGISGEAGIGASSGKDAFRLSKVPLLLHEASSTVYSGGIGK